MAKPDTSDDAARAGGPRHVLRPRFSLKAYRFPPAKARELLEQRKQLLKTTPQDQQR